MDSDYEAEKPFYAKHPEIFNNLEGNWYIEIWALAHGVTKMATGLFYKCDQKDMTKAVFDSAKEKGMNDEGRDFVLVLRREDDTWEAHDKVQITKDHFEKITGLKALSADEYFQNCLTVPRYTDIGATLIDFQSLKKS